MWLRFTVTLLDAIRTGCYRNLAFFFQIDSTTLKLITLWFFFYLLGTLDMVYIFYLMFQIIQSS